MYTCCSALFEVSRSTPDLTRCIRQVDATPSDVSLLCKGGVGMRPGQRFGLSAIEKRDVWSRWKAGRCMRLGALLISHIAAFARCCCLAAAFLPPLVAVR